jgi:hypothetical protein
VISRWWAAADRAGGGLWLDLALYAVGAAFAGLTAATSTLVPHRAWGAIAVVGYTAAAAATAVGLRFSFGTRTRAVIAAVAWLGTALVPLAVQAAQRAAGRTDRAQEEVVVIEHGGQRLLETGSPYLSHDAIASLPPAEWLLGYLPYQPGMALFGLPRALAGPAWWTDARVWFALATAVALALAVLALTASPTRSPRSRDSGPALPTFAPDNRKIAAETGAAETAVRALQAATVLPVCALTLATGGDDLPVLALCLLALALCARDRFGAAGVAAGLAGALKLFAWPVTLVLLVLALARGGACALGRFAAGALGLPLLALVPALLVDAGALVDNVIRFPLGDALVTSPAQSPFPGYLTAQYLPGGRAVAAFLLLATGVAIAVRLARRPPRTAAAAAALCAVGLLAAILLMPSTRFGYLLYPAALAVWVPALAAAAPLSGRSPSVGVPEGVHLEG